jgi:hypothetical protein
VSALETVAAFQKHLQKHVFQSISFKDSTANVLPSSRRLYFYAWPALVYSEMGEGLRMRKSVQTANIHSARCQYQTLKQSLWHYGIFVAKLNQPIG